LITSNLITLNTGLLCREDHGTATVDFVFMSVLMHLCACF